MKIKKCRICGNQDLKMVLNLGEQHLTGIFPKDKFKKITKGPLALVKCVGGGEVCGLVQLAHTYDLGELYGENYGYRSGLNKSMVSHLRAKVEKIISTVHLTNNDLVVDIGSNDGTTLGFYPENLDLIGIDPSAEKFRTYYKNNIELIVDFFCSSLLVKTRGNKKAKVITSFSMFYDLEDPLYFMKEIHEVLDEDGIWVFEQSYVQYMIDQNSYDTVCQEHLEYYAIKQIKWMCDNVGFKIIDIEFNSVNGGSFSVVVAKNTSILIPQIEVNDLLQSEKIRGLDSTDIWNDFSKRITKSKTDLINFLTKAKKNDNKVFGLGASTKGNVILQYCGITEELLPYVGEVNEDKFGAYTPGTLIPIIAEDEMLQMNPDYILVLPWHFREFFISNPKFKGMKLVFPLPNFEIVEC